MAKVRLIHVPASFGGLTRVVDGEGEADTCAHGCGRVYKALWRASIRTCILVFYSIVEMDQLTEGLIQEAYRRSREVCQEIEKLQNKRRGIVADTQNKRRKVAELEQKIAQLQIERGDLWAYGARLQIPTYSASQG